MAGMNPMMGNPMMGNPMMGGMMNPMMGGMMNPMMGGGRAPNSNMYAAAGSAAASSASAVDPLADRMGGATRVPPRPRPAAVVQARDDFADFQSAGAVRMRGILCFPSASLSWMYRLLRFVSIALHECFNVLVFILGSMQLVLFCHFCRTRFPATAASRRMHAGTTRWSICRSRRRRRRPPLPAPVDSYVYSPSRILVHVFSCFSRMFVLSSFFRVFSLSPQGAFGAPAAKPQNAGYGFGGGSLGGPAGKEDPFASIGLASSAPQPQRGGASA